jgi:glycosyltransferase involved in cell wall biosynthesis
MNRTLAGKRIGLLTSSASRLNGGVFEAVLVQADMIRRLGGEAHVFALHDRHTDDDRPRFGVSPVVTAPVVGPQQVGYAPGLLPLLLGAGLDCLHLHGIWMYPSAAGQAWARQTGRPYIISPHGMLDPWITARGRLKKAVARLAYERASWRSAWGLHALTSREASDITREAARSDSFVIPNAGPLPTAHPATGRSNTIFYISRIHPKKNVLTLVQAWLQAKRPADAQLVIAGWGADHDVAELEAAVALAGPSVTFIGPTFGERKAELLASSRFVVLPSLSEGLPVAILEAWAEGTPVIMTDQCNLGEGFASGAALACGYDAAAIAPVLEAALAMDDAQWVGMSAAALSLASTHFSAQRITGLWGQTYLAAIHGDTSQSVSNLQGPPV